VKSVAIFVYDHNIIN